MSIDLITGATGLVGGNLARKLTADGRSVRLLVRKKANISHLAGLPNVEFVYGDVTDADSLVRASRGAQRFYHCAAFVAIAPGMADQMWAVNVNGTINALRAAVRNGVARFIYCSSIDAIGLPEDNRPSVEETPWNWDRLGLDNPYARTKYEAQKYVLAAAQEIIDAVVVNPAYMFGAYDVRPSSGQMILEVAAGKARAYPTGGNNFVDVADVVSGMIAAAERGRRGECYILGHENLTYREIFSRIANIVGVPPPALPLPYPLARIGGWLGDLTAVVTRQEQTLNSVVAKLGYIRHYYSGDKAVQELGMPQTPIDQAISRAVDWFKTQGMLPQ